MTTALTFIMVSICGPGGSRDGWVTDDPDDRSIFCHKILISPPLKSAERHRLGSSNYFNFGNQL